MMHIAILQETCDDKGRMLTCAISVARSYPDSPIIIACDEATKMHIEGYFKHSNNLKHIVWFVPSHLTFTARNYIRNFLELLAHAILNGNEVLFLHSRTILLKQVPILPEICEQGFAIMRKNIKGHKERPDIRYSCDVVYANSSVALSSIENYFRENGIFEDPEQEDFNKLINIWRYMPVRLDGTNDGKLAMINYIDGGGYMTTENFFAFENTWELNKLACKVGELLYDGNLIWGTCIDISGTGPILSLSRDLITRVIATHRWTIPLIELRMSSIVIASPKKEGILHWNRTNSPFYSMVSAICKNSPYIRTSESNIDYFVLSNYVLLDKPGVKWLTNRIKDADGFIYFDYDNELLKTLPMLGKPVVFGGYVVPYPDVLEKASVVEDRESNTYFSATSQPFASNEEEYAQHLEKLARCTHAYINADTPKHRISECARLGVIPCIDSEVTIVELPELLALADTDSDKVDTCMRYYDNHLSIQSITHKLIYTVFNRKS